MPRYVKDEINFHKFLDAMRQLKDVTLENETALTALLRRGHCVNVEYCYL